MKQSKSKIKGIIEAKKKTNNVYTKKDMEKYLPKNKANKTFRVSTPEQKAKRVMDYPKMIAIPKFESNEFRESVLDDYKANPHLFKVKKISKKSDSIDAYLIKLNPKRNEKKRR